MITDTVRTLRKTGRRANLLRSKLKTARVALAVAAWAGLLNVRALAHTAASQGGVQLQNVVHGTATISQHGTETQITATNGAIINFKSFDIPQGSSVNIVLPNPAGRVYDRVVSSSTSEIDGSLSSNGSVYLANPAGISFGSTATVNMAGLYVVAGNLSDAAFTSGQNQFTDVSGAISNQGSLHTAGDLVLAGRTVVNTGTITSDHGAVALVSGQNVLVAEKNSQLFAQVSPTAGSKGFFSSGDLYSLALKNGGRIKAPQVTLQADATSGVSVSGTIDASSTAAGSHGGNVSITGGSVVLATATINASGTTGGGNVNIGGDHHGQGSLANASFTSISSDSTIHADALSSGNGGNVVVWSGQASAFAGTISARGSATGAGGEAEVSSHAQLEYLGSTDLRGGSGKNGTLLLDPQNIVIDSTATGDSTFSGTILSNTNVVTTTITPAQILSAALTGNVLLEATSSITVAASSPIVFPSATITPSLVLSAPLMTFNSPVTGSVNLTMKSPTGLLTITGTNSATMPTVSTQTPPLTVLVVATHLTTTPLFATNNLTLEGPNTKSGPTLIQSVNFTGSVNDSWPQGATLGSVNGDVAIYALRFTSPPLTPPVFADGIVSQGVLSPATALSAPGTLAATASISFVSFDTTTPPIFGAIPGPTEAGFLSAVNPAPAIAANSTPVEAIVPVSKAGLGQNAREKLKLLQINVNKADEALAEGTTFSVIMDWPPMRTINGVPTPVLKPQAADYGVSPSRVSITTANKAANDYTDLFGENNREKIAGVKLAINNLVKDRSDLKPAAFAAEVYKLPAGNNNRQTMIQLMTLKDDIANLGLSQAEQDSSYRAWMNPLLPQPYSYLWFKDVLKDLDRQITQRPEAMR